MKLAQIVLSIGLSIVPILAEAQTDAQVNNQVITINNLTANQGQTHVIEKISGDFSSFLGSDAKTVVTALRNGTPISLSSTTTAVSSTGAAPTTTTTVITPPTGQMGFGNVYISLALAKQQLSSLGIIRPTAEQLRAALTGGSIIPISGTATTGTTSGTQLQGILTMRSQNMGWGQIAQKLGFKLGPVMASMKSAHQSLAATTAATTSNTSGAHTGVTTSSSESGIVSAGGKAHGSSPVIDKPSRGGIVTASGRGNGHANGMSASSGVVSGTGNGSASNGAIVSARGGGNGTIHGKGHIK